MYTTDDYFVVFVTVISAHICGYEELYLLEYNAM
jgi:hypothetical protein